MIVHHYLKYVLLLICRASSFISKAETWQAKWITAVEAQDMANPRLAFVLDVVKNAKFAFPGLGMVDRNDRVNKIQGFKKS